MAGLIAGKDSAATKPYDLKKSNSFIGVAPDAHIVSVKVADDQGATTQSAVIAAIGWVVTHRNDSGLNIRVLNLSLGARSGVKYTQDPLAAAAEAAWKSGIVVVSAAGNDGQVGLLSPHTTPTSSRSRRWTRSHPRTTATTPLRASLTKVMAFAIPTSQQLARTLSASATPGLPSTSSTAPVRVQ